jgi:UDP-2-acetamido-2,6-beta-L-arabino-hexul-4-ose reductase
MAVVKNFINIVKLNTNGKQPKNVETVTGWSHVITNVGNDEMIIMLWANEIFDREKPDTYTALLKHI